MEVKGGLQLGDLIDLKNLSKPEESRTVLYLNKRNPKLSGAASQLAESLEKGSSVHISEIGNLTAAIREALDKSNKVEYFGDQISLEEFHSIENREFNETVYGQIERGDPDCLGSVNLITYLPSRIACMTAKKAVFNLSFQRVEKLSVGTAQSLCEYTGELGVWFRQIDAQSAKVLSKSKGVLVFVGLEDISVEVARELAEFPGRMEIKEYVTISDEVAEALAAHRGELQMNWRNARKVNSYKNH